MEKETRIFKALADRNRLRILKILERRTLCVCEIKEVIGLSVSTISSHLNILKNAGLIRDYKDGKWVNYSLNVETGDSVLRAVFLLISLLLNDDPVIKKDLEVLPQIHRELICAT